MIRVVIPGLPVAQGRPRLAVVGGHARAYSPAKATSWRGSAQVHMQRALSECVNPWATPAFPPGVPLRVSIEAVWPQPASAPKRDRALRRYRPSRPDADNVGKAVLDAGNGILWHDDAQVAVLQVVKVTGTHGEAPHVTVTVSAFDSEAWAVPA